MNRANSLLLKTLLPVAIGLAVVVWLFASEFDIADWKRIPWNLHTILAIGAAWLFMAGREAGLAWRFRCMTDRDLSWKQAIKVTMLCEFTSAITPTTAGGSALSMVFMNREGISGGRATTLMMCTLFLDEAFFVVMCPVIFLLVPSSVLFGFDTGSVGSGIRWAFWAVYCGIVLWTLLLFAGIFLRPHKVGEWLTRLFRLKWLRRWEKDIAGIAHSMVTTSEEIKTRSWKWWTEAIAATVTSWVSRYLVVNALFIAFATGASQLVVFARQFVVWTLLTVSPTPGGSGVSEWLFTAYYGDLISDASVALVIAICWRIITYYVYLATGALMIPSWVKQGVRNHHKQ